VALRLQSFLQIIGGAQLELILPTAWLLLGLVVVLAFIGYSAWPREEQTPLADQAPEQGAAAAKGGG